MNTLRTGLLLAALTGLFLAVGYLLAGEGGALIAFLIALAMNGWAYWNSDKMVLRMHRAREVTREQAPDLVGLVSHDHVRLVHTSTTERVERPGEERQPQYPLQGLGPLALEPGSSAGGEHHGARHGLVG